MNMNVSPISRPADRWIRSSRCKPTGDCVEVNPDVAGGIGIRDSKAGPSTPFLTFGRAQWSAFVASRRFGV